MKTLTVDVLENDIIRAMKNLQYSPIEHAASRVLKENVANIEAKKHDILIWNNDDSDYESYRYCDDSIEEIRLFIEEWEDYKDKIIDDFCSQPFSFNIEKNR